MKSQTKKLTAPDISVAEVDGLIKTKDLTHDIEVKLEVWSYSEPGDSYQLMIDETPIGPVKKLPTDPLKQGEPLTLSIDAQSMLIKNGTYRIGYRVHSTLGGMFADSITTTVWVDRKRPGAGLLAPMIFPVKPCGSALIGLIPCYAGIAAGDVIQTRCNYVSGPVHVVESHEIDQVVNVAFPWDFLEGMNTSTVKFEYVVTDRAGNTSLQSQPAWITVRV